MSYVKNFSGQILLKFENDTIKDFYGSIKYRIRDNKVFDFSAYIEIVGDEGPTGEYLKYTYPNCTGGFISPNFKDGEYFAAEYTVKSRPAIGAAAYTVELVSELPEGANLLMHPAVRQIKEEI